MEKVAPDIAYRRLKYVSDWRLVEENQRAARAAIVHGISRLDAAGHWGDGEPPRILVVDDDPRMLRFVRDALSGAGYAPLLTGAPHDLRRIIRAERPRLVLLDLMLPDIGGIELMRQVPELADLPVIFISAYRRDETVAKALESGAADYIVKPFSPTELVARIRAALRRREAPEPFAVGDLAIHLRAPAGDGRRGAARARPRRGGSRVVSIFTPAAVQATCRWHRKPGPRSG